MILHLKRNHRLYLLLLLFLAVSWPFLSGNYHYFHDMFYYMGVRTYFLESLLKMDFPWWNPYSHGGEPFWITLSSVRFRDPFWLLGYPVSLFTDNIVTILYYTDLARLMFNAIGAYLFITLFTRDGKARMFAFAATLLGILTIGLLWQGGVRSFQNFPMIYFLFHSAISQKKPLRMFLAAFVLLISTATYLILVMGTMMVLFALTYLAADVKFRNMFREFLKDRKGRMAILLSVVMIFASYLYEILLFSMRNMFVYVMRMNTTENAGSLNYEYVEGVSKGVAPLMKNDIISSVFPLAPFSETCTEITAFAGYAVVLLFFMFILNSTISFRKRVTPLVLMLLIMKLSYFSVVFEVFSRVLPLVGMIRHPYVFFYYFIFLMIVCASLSLARFSNFRTDLKSILLFFGFVFIVILTALTMPEYTTMSYPALDSVLVGIEMIRKGIISRGFMQYAPFVLSVGIMVLMFILRRKPAAATVVLVLMMFEMAYFQVFMARTERRTVPPSVFALGDDKFDRFDSVMSQKLDFSIRDSKRMFRRKEVSRRFPYYELLSKEYALNTPKSFVRDKTGFYYTNSDIWRFYNLEGPLVELVDTERLLHDETDIVPMTGFSESGSSIDYRINLEQFVGNRIDIILDTGATGLLFLRSRYSEEWKCTLNGKKTVPIVLNGIYMGVRIDRTGTSELSCSYVPDSASLVIWAMISPYVFLLIGFILLGPCFEGLKGKCFANK